MECKLCGFMRSSQCTSLLNSSQLQSFIISWNEGQLFILADASPIRIGISTQTTLLVLILFIGSAKHEFFIPFVQKKWRTSKIRERTEKLGIQVLSSRYTNDWNFIVKQRTGHLKISWEERIWGVRIWVPIYLNGFAVLLRYVVYDDASTMYPSAVWATERIWEIRFNMPIVNLWQTCIVFYNDPLLKT